MTKSDPGAGIMSSAKELIKQFGCHNCTWIGTPLCPFGLKQGQRHKNGTCRKRIVYAHEHFQLINDHAKYLQVEKAFMLREMEQRMFTEYAQTGEVPKDFVPVAKISTNLINTMRTQDEGQKIQVDGVMFGMNKFREIVDAQYDILQGKVVESPLQIEGCDDKEEEDGDDDEKGDVSEGDSVKKRDKTEE